MFILKMFIIFLISLCVELDILGRNEVAPPHFFLNKCNFRLPLLLYFP